jgi:hypothetical protein
MPAKAYSVAAKRGWRRGADQPVDRASGRQRVSS